MGLEGWAGGMGWGAVGCGGGLGVGVSEREEEKKKTFKQSKPNYDCSGRWLNLHASHPSSHVTGRGVNVTATVAPRQRARKLTPQQLV